MLLRAVDELRAALLLLETVLRDCDGRETDCLEVEGGFTAADRLGAGCDEIADGLLRDGAV